MLLTLKILQRALGGDITGGQLLVPGPAIAPPTAA